MAKDQSWIADLLTGAGSSGGEATTLANNYTQPAHGSTVVVTVEDATAAAVGNTATVNGSQKYTITAVDSPEVTLLNDTLTNTTSGVINAGSVVVFGGPALPNLMAPRFFADLTNTQPTAIRAVVFTDGFATVGDGGHGTWSWKTGSFTNDGGTVVVPTGQAGIGAWCRQFSDHVYNVRWFGALGLYSQDDGPFIQAAANAAGVNGLIYVPAGIYQCGAPIRLLQGQTLYGSNLNGTTLRSDGSANHSPFGFQTQNAVVMMTPATHNYTPVFSTRGGVTYYTFSGSSTSTYLNIGQHCCVSFDGQATFAWEAWVDLEGVTGDFQLVGVRGQPTTHWTPTCMFGVEVQGGTGGNRTVLVNLRTTSNIATTTNDPQTGPGSLIGNQLTYTNLLTGTGDHNIKISYDGSKVRLYLDGVYVAPSSGTPTMTGTLVQNWWDIPYVNGFQTVYGEGLQGGGTNTWQIASQRYSNIARYTSEAGGTLYPGNTSPLPASDTNTVHLLEFTNAAISGFPTGNIEGLDVHTISNTTARGAYDVMVRIRNAYNIQFDGTSLNTISGLTLQSNGTVIDGESAPKTAVRQCQLVGPLGIALNNNCFYPSITDCIFGSNQPLSANYAAFRWASSGITTSTYVQPAPGNSVTIAVPSTGAAVGMRYQNTYGGEYIITAIPDSSHLTCYLPPESCKQFASTGATVPTTGNNGRFGYKNCSEATGTGIRLTNTSGLYTIKDITFTSSTWGMILGGSGAGIAERVIVNGADGHGAFYINGGDHDLKGVGAGNESTLTDFALLVLNQVGSVLWRSQNSAISLQNGPTGEGVIIDGAAGTLISEGNHLMSKTDGAIYRAVSGGTPTYAIHQVNPEQTEGIGSPVLWSDGTADVVIDSLEPGGESDWTTTADADITCQWGALASPTGPDFSCQRIAVSPGTAFTTTRRLNASTAAKGHRREIVNNMSEPITFGLAGPTGAQVTCAANKMTPVYSTGTGWVQNGTAF